MPGYVYNLCFAVEPPRRGFFLAKNCISQNFGHCQRPNLCRCCRSQLLPSPLPRTDVIKGLRPCRRPQKIDFLSNFIEIFSILIKFYIEIEIFRYNLGREYSGICLQPLFCCGTTPQGLFSGQKVHFQNFWTWSFFKK